MMQSILILYFIVKNADDEKTCWMEIIRRRSRIKNMAKTGRVLGYLEFTI